MRLSTTRNRWSSWKLQYAPCTNVLWRISAKEHSLIRPALILTAFATGLVASAFTKAAEPVLTMREVSVPAIPAPQCLSFSFYTFEPEEFWGEPRDSWWLGVSAWVIRQERQHEPMVQSLGAWADRSLSGSSQALP